MPCCGTVDGLGDWPDRKEAAPPVVTRARQEACVPAFSTLADLLFPARDPRFGAEVRALSRAESGPAADNLVSNEDSYPRPCGQIVRAVAPGGVYLGVGPDQNYTLMAHAQPALAVVVDYRRRNLLLHLLHKALFALGRDRVGYLERLTARRPAGLAADPSPADLVAAFRAARFDRGLLEATRAEVQHVLRPLDVVGDAEWPALATIQAKLAGPGLDCRFLALPMYPTLARLIATTDRLGQPAHVLSSDRLYGRVRALHLGDRVLPLVGDYGQPDGLRPLAEWLRRHGLAVSVVYVSDVEFFLLRSGRLKTYLANLALLPRTDEALIVRTSTREIAHPERVRGDSSTTIARPLAAFLEAGQAGRIRVLDDLFAPAS